MKNYQKSEDCQSNKKKGTKTKEEIQIIFAAFLGHSNLTTYHPFLVWKTQEPSPFSCFLHLPPNLYADSLSVSRFFGENAKSTAFYDKNLFSGNHKIDVSSQLCTQLLRISIYLPYQSTSERWIGLCLPAQPVSSEITLMLFVIIGHLQEWKSA